MSFIPADLAGYNEHTDHNLFKPTGMQQRRLVCPAVCSFSSDNKDKMLKDTF